MRARPTEAPGPYLGSPVAAGEGRRNTGRTRKARVVNCPPLGPSPQGGPVPRAQTCACAHRSCVRRRLMDRRGR
eukprot:166664-Prymnesium_polylepis.1